MSSSSMKHKNMKMKNSVLYFLVMTLVSTIPVESQDCLSPLGLSTNQISDDSLSATTWQPGRSDPWYGRLNNQSRRSWCSTVLDINQYIQADLGPKQRRITAIASQGSHNYNEWVTSYKLSYSADSGKWKYYEEADKTKIFSASDNRWTEVKHQINPPIIAAALRFHPVEWSGDMCMRVEAFGCDVFSEALGVENNTIIKDKYIIASHYRNGLVALKGRLNFPSGSWEADGRFETTYLEISFGRQMSVITAIATQGSGFNQNWVKTYKLSFSTWGEEWIVYNEDGKAKVFPGNKDQNTVVKHYLRHNVTALLIRFLPESWHNYIAMRVEVYGGKVCQKPLGAENGDLTNLLFTASSQQAGNEPWKGRLNGTKAWCTGKNDAKQYLQIDLERVRTVSRVATQGHPVNSHWVKQYGLSYSTDGIFWKKTLGEDKSKGNSDGNTVQEVSLYKHVTARFLRFLPEAWNKGICIRVEVYGCEDCAYPIGLERGVVPNEAFSASSWYDVDHEPWLARLYSREGEGAWCALENDGAQYLQVDLGQVHIITGVATQGKYKISEWAMRFRAWVTNFSLAFSDDQMSWTNYVEDGNTPKIFEGNSQRNQVVRRTLLKRIVSRHLRFLPVTWFGWTCMRVEIFGCRACSTALGMEDLHIPDNSIVSSSTLSSWYSWRGRLFRSPHPHAYAWMASTTDRNAYLQIEIDRIDHVITAVATQGHKTIQSAVVKFQLSFSRDGLHWFDYREDGEVKIFEMTFESNTVTKNFLKRNVTARFVRFWPKEWHGRRYMRVEVYGCKVCKRSINPSNVTEGVKYPDVLMYNGSVFTPWQGALQINNASDKSSWCANDNDSNKNHFLQLDFKLVKVIQTVAIQAHSTEDKWVKTFTISSSLDGIFWNQYKEAGILKVIDGNTDRHSVVAKDIKYNLRVQYLRIHPQTWNNYPCLRLEVFAKEDCSDALGMENGYITDESITASSALRVNYEPWLARLHSQLGEGAWCAGKNDENQYLHIDLLYNHRVRRVATQGKYPVPGCTTPDAWVTSFMLQFRQDMVDWWNYTESGMIRIFSGNVNPSRVAIHRLKNHVTARYVRFRPINWFNKICMRVEIYGCKACLQPLGMEDYSIPKRNVRSPFHGYIEAARLNFYNGFCGGRSEIFYQINLGPVLKIVTAVATQGKFRGHGFIRTYRLAFSRREGEWFYYKENGEVKELQGNTNPDDTVLNMLQYQVTTRDLRLATNNWLENTCLRMEVHGCETCSDPMGISSGLISNDNMTSSSNSGTGNEPWMGRLKVGPGTKAWCAAPSDTTPYLQIDLGRVVVVNQIAVAGKSGRGMVTKFKLSSSEEGSFWSDYRIDGVMKEFDATEDYSQAFKYQLRFEIKARLFKFLPQTWASESCMSVELYGYEVCSRPLGLSEWKTPNEAMSASSSLGTNYAPWMGRLGAKVGGGAWCAKSNDIAQYLQIDLGHVTKIRRLGIQGKEGVSRHPALEKAWVKSFTVAYSVDGFAWTSHQDASGPKVFTGNVNSHEVSFISLDVAIIGRHFRIFPQSWHHHMCMRIELYGCEACGDPLGMENYRIPNHSLRVSEIFSSGAEKVRLNEKDNFILLPRKDEYVQVDLGPGGKTVTGLVLQGYFTKSNQDWIRKFVVNYSRDGIEFFSYMENGTPKTHHVPLENHWFSWKHRLQHNITARYIRVIIKDWVKRAAMRLELYGCEASPESYGIGNDPIPVSSWSASSSKPSHEPEKAKLLSQVGSWCAGTTEPNEYLQLDFGKAMMLTGIASQGHHDNDQYVSKYRLDYSVDGATWFRYTQALDLESAKVELDANTDSTRVRMKRLLYEVKARFLRIVAKNWHNGICLRVQVFGFKVCDGDLGMETSNIANGSITASSHLGEGYGPWNARYNRHQGTGAWCARDNKKDEYIEVDLKRVHVISRVAVQKKLKASPGDAVGEAWVTKFVFAYSTDGSSWSLTEYSESSGGGVKEFAGNKRHMLANPVHARFVRLIIKEWHKHICLKMELYGCKACLEPLGLGNFQIPDASLTSSTSRSWLWEKRVRLGYHKREMWCSKYRDLNQFVKIDLGKIKNVTAIATQGNSHQLKEARLREYYLQYSDDGSNWVDYTCGGKRKIFHGYKTQVETSLEFLPQNITARFIKLRPTHWYGEICTKLEIYGCEA